MIRSPRHRKQTSFHAALTSHRTWYARVFYHRVVRARAVRTIFEHGPVAVPNFALIVVAWPQLLVTHVSVDIGDVLRADPRGVFVAFETRLGRVVLRLDADADRRHGDVQTVVSLARQIDITERRSTTGGRLA